ncbi:MAG: DUF4167 domain-containing protein [Pseudomonadota bacterium]
MKRQRGRNRRSGGGGNNPNRHFESNGPDVKIRGSAQQVLDKYLQYARDAQTSGDRVMSEAYFQHAEHYQRLLAAMQPKEKPRRDRDDREDASDENSEDVEARSDDAASDDGDSATQDDKSDSDSKPRSRSRGRKPRDSDRDGSKDEANAPDALKVIDGDGGEDSMDGTDEAAKPRRRRTYKKRETAEAETGNASEGDDEGVMKTLSRGRAKADASPDAAGDESSSAPAAE